MFSIPRMKKLLATSKRLVELYENKRTEFDSQRFFSYLRPVTSNQERLDYATFIKNLAEHLEIIKFNYADFDPSFEFNSYNNEIAPYLKRVITGAMLLELINITNTYNFETSVKDRSALCNVILETFNINKLSDVPNETLELCLNDLARYLKVPSDHQTHPSKSNEALLDEVNEHMPDLNTNVI